jgi:phage host-nuclease inhibitor protein Gam
MAKKTKAKTGAAKVHVPQNRDEADLMIMEIGSAQMQLARIEARLKLKTAQLKAGAEAEASLHRTILTERTEGLKIWAEANRKTLTRDGRTKTVELGAGKIAWRILPPRVTIRGVEDVLAHLRLNKLVGFIRTKEEIDKEAMLKDPRTAREIPGVSIGSEGEEFVVEPAGLELAEK